MKTAKALLLSVLIATVPAAARADWRLGAETGVLYDSNLSNSDRSSDIRDDWAWRTEARIGNGFQLTRDLRLDLAGDLRSALWARFDGFDEIGPGASVGLRYRFGLGRQAPWVLLEDRIGYDRFRETFRSVWDESLHLRTGVAISERIAVEAGYTFENLAAPGRFFDQQGNRADARIIFDATTALQVGLGYSYRNGDIISYAVPSRPDIFEIASVRPTVTTFGTNPAYNAYRLQGVTHAVSFFAAYALTKYFSVQASYEYAATSHDPLHYENHIVEAKIVFAY